MDGQNDVFVKAAVDQRITARGTVMFLPSLAISWSPRVRSVSSQEYLSIRHTDSRGTLTDMRRERQHPSLELMERMGLIWQTGRWAAVFSETRTCMRLFDFF